jgi:hypothetical protein
MDDTCEQPPSHALSASRETLPLRLPASLAVKLVYNLTYRRGQDADPG